MSDFVVEINANDVNKVVAKAVLESSIGTTIQKALNDYIERIGKPGQYGNPIKDITETIIKQIIIQEAEKYREQIKQIVAQQITDDMIKAAVKRVSDSLNRGF